MLLRVVSAPVLGDAGGAVFSVWGPLSPYPLPLHTTLREPTLVTFLL